MYIFLHIIVFNFFYNILIFYYIGQINRNEYRKYLLLVLKNDLNEIYF